MPLHINLHHEIDQQEMARRRDPLRVGLLVILIIAIGFVGYYFWVLNGAHGVNVRYGALQDQWSKLEPKYKTAKARQADLESQIKASDELMKNIDSRFYWAPILADILHSVPHNVQVVRVAADAPEGGLDNVVTVSGLAGGMEPRKEAEAVRIALASRLAGNCKHVSSAFKSLDDSDQYVMLDGRRLPTASFTLEFSLRVRDPVAAPAPGLIRKPKAETE